MRREIIPDLGHAQYLAAEGVSHSMLKILREKSPLHLRAAMDTPAPEPTDAQKIGTLTHAALLQPDILKDAFHVRPDNLKFTTKEGREWKEAHGDRLIIDTAELKAIEGMVLSVHRHPIAKRLLANATFEQSIFVEDDKGTLRKLRADILPNGGNMLPDLKTCDSAHRDDFEKAIAKWGYWSQGSYYLEGCRLAGMDFQNFVLIAVEKDYPHAVATYTIDPVALDYGRMVNEKSLAIYRGCLESGNWPGYEPTVSYIGLPPWLMKQAEQAAA